MADLAKLHHVRRAAISELLKRRGVQRRTHELDADDLCEARRLYEAGWGSYDVFVGANDLDGDAFPEVLTRLSGELYEHNFNGDGSYAGRIDEGLGFGGHTSFS
jgi:hypothetical protein